MVKMNLLLFPDLLVMANEISTGITGTKEIQVGLKDTASAYGSGLVEVFATPAMVALMEDTAQSTVQPLLDPGMTTVGSEIRIKHFRPTPVGSKVRCESLLKDIEGRKLFFEVHAYDEKGLIGSGTHSRYIVDREKFLAQLK